MHAEGQFRIAIRNIVRMINYCGVWILLGSIQKACIKKKAGNIFKIVEKL